MQLGFNFDLLFCYMVKFRFFFLAPVLPGPRAHCCQLHSLQSQREPAGHGGGGRRHPAVW